jgi:hypothetical protein
MALKRLIDVGVAFPVKGARLGAAPPATDVLDNVGEAAGGDGGTAVRQAGAPEYHNPVPEKAGAPAPVSAGETQAVREGRAGRTKTAVEYVPGKIRGGKRSGLWGRAPEEAREGDWIGAALPRGYRNRINRLALRHDLTIWQVLTEAVDLFAKTYGEDAPDDTRDARAGR